MFGSVVCAGDILDKSFCLNEMYVLVEMKQQIGAKTCQWTQTAACLNAVWVHVKPREGYCELSFPF